MYIRIDDKMVNMEKVTRIEKVNEAKVIGNADAGYRYFISFVGSAAVMFVDEAKRDEAYERVADILPNVVNLG